MLRAAAKGNWPEVTRLAKLLDQDARSDLCLWAAFLSQALEAADE